MTPCARCPQFLEKTGDFKAAMVHFEKSGCGPVEITRMLFQAGKYEQLEAYVQSQVRWRQQQWASTADRLGVHLGRYGT